MKKKILLVPVLFLLAMCLFIATASATTITDDASDTVTLGNCTIANLDGVSIPAPTVGLKYDIDFETKTATVSGRGSFTGGNLVFPSSITYDGNTFAVTKINFGLFQRLTYDLYIPDSITYIVGGSSVGTFGNSTIDKVYIGSGLSSFERETFSGSKGFNTFVCKSKPTYIGVYAFNSIENTGELGDYEFDLSNVVRIDELAFNGAKFLKEVNLGPNLEYIGPQAFVSCSNLNGTITVPENCTLSYRCFNGTSLDLVIIKVKDGETRELPTELFSGASSGLTVAIVGDAIAVGDYVYSGNSMVIHMQTLKQVEALAKSTSLFNDGKNRIGNVTFYACNEGKSYTASSDGTVTEKEETDAHIYGSEPVHFEANCSRYEKYAYICYCCGNESIQSEGTEYGAHDLVISTKEPSCQSLGYIEYNCLACDYEETVHFIGQAPHSGTVTEYKQKDYKTLIATYKCEFCNAVVSTEEISLVNKCYIEGYGLFDATLDYVNVSADGVATPSNASFDRATIYFPSCVKIGEDIVEVKTIQGFKAKSIRAIYIPDSVNRIAGGSGVGCFGDISDLKIVVVGKGVTRLEQEVFCMGGSASLNEFVFKGTITRLDYLCLSKMNASSATIPYEFNTALEYVGKQVNINGNILREATLVKNCDLTEKFAFNDANGLKTVYIVGGDTKEEALDLGQEMMSNTATINIYIKGYVTVSGQAVLSGQNNTRIYMSNTDAIDYFASAIKNQGYSDRIKQATFMDCSTGKAWYISNSADRIEHSTIAFAHGVLTEIVDASCSQNGTSNEKCFVCGNVVSSSEIPTTEHIFDSGVIVEMPTSDKAGIIRYTCLGCGKAEEKEISKHLGSHKEVVVVTYANGFTENGVAYISCQDCDHTETRVLEPIFTVYGYSVKDDKTGVTCGFGININALNYYEKNAGSIKLGFILANANDVAQNGLVDAGFELVDGVRGVQAEITQREYIHIDIKVSGAETDVARAFAFVLTLYVVADKDNDGVNEISYIQGTIPNDSDYQVNIGNAYINTVSIDRAYGL